SGPGLKPVLVVCFSHNKSRTTFIHPQTGVTSTENSTFILHELPQSGLMSSLSDSSTNASNNKTLHFGSKLHRFGKRQFSVKRNLKVSVQLRGWIYKQDGSGMRLWKRKWFVLSDFCLFYYKDSREQSVLGSIPLLSYEVCPVSALDHISRKFSFKACSTVVRTHLDKRSSVIGPLKRSCSLIGSQAEHSGMRTYFFSAETQEDMNAWIKAMNRASRAQTGVQTEVKAEVKAEVQNGVRKVQNGVHCGTNTTTDRSSDLLDSTQSSEKTLVHEVQLEPVQRVQSPAQDPDQGSLLKAGSVSPATSRLTTPPEEPDHAPSQNRFPVSTPSPILEPNGIAAGTYQRTPPSETPPGSVYRPATPMGRQTTPTGSTFRQATPPNSSLTRNGVREQVQNWVKVQRDENRGSTNRDSFHRRTPPAQFSPIEPPHELNAPGGRVGEYRYAQDRLSHFGFSDSLAPASFWRLYEWQQRHQYRHGNPTAPLYSPTPLHPYGPRPLAVADQSVAPTPRCIEVPPSAAEIPPSLPSGPISRRPHTPSERLTVRPTNERPAEGGAFTAAPRRSQSWFFKTSTLERCSLLPSAGYMTHTVSAPSLHGKTPEELTLLLIQLRRQQSKMAALRRDIHFLSDNTDFLSTSPTPRVSPGPCVSQVDDSYLQLKKDLEYLDLKMEQGRILKERTRLRAAESDLDVKLSRLCEQDKSLKDLESRIRALQQDKDELEAVLALSHQQMEQFSDQTYRQKISLHQKVLQEDLVQVRAQLSRTCTDMARSLEEFVLLEKSVEHLRSALQDQMDLSTSQSERTELKQELWRVEDVLAGLHRPPDQGLHRPPDQADWSTERKLVPSVQESVPSTPNVFQSELNWADTHSPPPRPPLPCGFYDNDDSQPEVPPLPREAAVIRHTSVRGLKRQSDERRRDRDGAEWKVNPDSDLV
ncbi:pleckstrin homology domain-containing family A member 7-like, partial [Eucyclogobius newberryi]|uniref:pleckstrin homology domain-containing family A member 7-like n=1 Tax=Eucyclogobius newberryi TaxID=166745 RepID=UPI003B5A50DF